MKLGKLRKLKHLGATDPIETWWIGKFELLCRYYCIEEQRKCLEYFECNVPSRFQNRILKDAMTHYFRFLSISVLLEAESISISQFRF